MESREPHSLSGREQPCRWAKTPTSVDLCDAAMGHRYDRLRGGLEPACATACPTDSIQFGPLDELRAIAQSRLEELHAGGEVQARLYGADPDDGIGGAGAFFLLLDEPEVYGLPPDPVVTTRDLPRMWRWAGAAAGVLAAGVAVAFAGRTP